MVDGSSSLCFTLEALKRSWVAGYVFGKKLQCNFALQLQVFGTVDHTHPATAKLLDDAIVRNNLVQDRRCKA
jgi:hypothetical protein